MLTCPYCKSKNSKRIEAIISQGSKEVDLGTLVGLGGFGGSGKSGMKIGALGGKASTKGKIQSTLSKRLNSMRPRKPGIFALIFFGPALFIGALVGIFSPNGQVAGFIMGLIFVYWAYNTYQGRKHFPERLDKFQRTWYCFDCDKLSLTRK